MTTIRTRITALATVVVLAVLVLAGLALVMAHARLLTENLDESLAESADAIEASLASGDIPAVLGGVGDDDAVAQVIDESGAVIASTANVVGAPRIVTPEGPRPHTVEGIPVDDADYRVLTRVVPGFVIVVAGSLGDVEESTGTLVASLGVAVPLIVITLALVIWWLIGRALRPVEAIRAEVASIGAAELHRRVPQPAGGDEIARLATTMNAMLDRIEGAARRQSEFVADAAHELRSPLTRIRTELEVDLAHAEQSDPLATHRSVLEETVGLQRLVEDLLHLARADAGAPVAGEQPVDLDDLALSEARRARASGRLFVDSTGVGAAQVRGDGAQLERAVANLVDNAMRHARTTVAIAVAECDGRAILTVTDDGPGIPLDQHERVFERFTRIDPARAAAFGGTGLGLPIARAIVERHGGTLTIDATYDVGARFVVALALLVPSPSEDQRRSADPDGSPARSRDATAQRTAPS